jgi:hypothetical protein
VLALLLPLLLQASPVHPQQQQQQQQQDCCPLQLVALPALLPLPASLHSLQLQQQH